MKPLKLWLCVAACFLSISLFAQIDIPVDPLTGQAQVSVPLGAVSYGSLTVPITLSYDARGVKPQSSEGNAGMNWTLFAGGQVSREVRGLPDDYNGNASDATDQRRGWLINYATEVNNFTPTSDDNLTVCSDEFDDWTFINDLSYIRDSEPDVFSFDAPGLSGRFVFGADKLPKLMPYQDVKIEFSPSALNAPITQIIITKNEGTKYIFSLPETTNRISGSGGVIVSQMLTISELYRKAVKYNSSWKLTKIQAPTGEEINLTYSASSSLIKSNNIQVASASGTVYDQVYFRDFVETRKLSTIKSPQTTATVTYQSELLSRVEFTQKEATRSKTYQLNYLEAKNAAEQVTRKFLKEIRETNALCNSFPAFQFEYYDIVGTFNATTTIPFNSPDTKQDLWGYFNDIATSKVPTIYYYNSKAGAERYRFYPIPSVTPTATINNGADRAVNPNKIHFGSLKTITYPTGGTATISYEPNQYYDAEAATSQYGPGLRVKQVVLKDNVIAGSNDIITDYEYKAPDNTSSGKWVYRSVFGYHDVSNFYATTDDQSPEAAIYYSRVSVSQPGKGKRIYDYILPGMYPLTTASPDWNASQTKFVRGTSGSCVSVGELKKHYYSHPFAPNTNYDFERGLLSKVSDFNQAGQKVYEKSYTYQRLGTTSALVKGIRYHKLNGTSNISTGANAGSNIYVFSQYTLLANVGKVVLTEIERSADMTDVTKFHKKTTSYTYSNVHQMLQSIASDNSDGVTNKTRFKYAKDFSNLTNPNTADTKSKMLKKLNDDFRHGTPIETITSVIKSGTETTTGASIILYGNFPDSLGAERALPAETRTFFDQSGFTEATITPSSGSNQILDISSSVYKPANFVEGYDYLGNAITVSDISKARRAYHIGYKKSVPVLEISNAAANEVVYAGFETYTGGEFNIVPVGATYPAGRTGKKAIELAAGNVLERTSLTKGKGNYYRYSCWIFYSAPTQVSFKTYNGATLLQTAQISYTASDANQWKYYEGRISVTTAPSQFKLKVETTAGVMLDDIAFYPETADIAITTYDLFAGKSSVSDSRGNTIFYEYDALGRLSKTLDKDKNLRRTDEYYYKNQPYPALYSQFGASHLPHQVVKDVHATFYAPIGLNCDISPITYDWYVDGQLVGNNLTTFQYTFSQKKVYVLKLVVTNPTLGSQSTTVTYDVKTIGSGPIGLTAATSDGSTSYAYCDDYYGKTFTTSLTGCYVPEDVSYRWYYSTGGDVWNEYMVNNLPQTGATITFDALNVFGGVGNLVPYSIRCIASTICPVTGIESTSTSTVSITYNGSTLCP
jgi:YD repeat-containing protein